LAIGHQLGMLSFSTLRSVAVPLLYVMVAVSLASMYWYLRPLFEPEGGDAQAREMRKRLFGPVFFTVLPLFVLFCLYSYLVAARYDIGARRYLLYVLLNGGFHGLIILGSLIVAKEFRLEKNGQPLKRINLPLFLSFCRICAVPTLVFLFLHIEEIDAALVLVPLLAFIFLTDLLDGLLARGLKLTTRIGRILDATGDYVLIFSISLVYRIIDFIPTWLFALIIVRLAVQAAGIIILYLLRGYSYLKLSFLGKASVFSVFTIYGIELLEYLQVPGLGHPTVVTILELVTAGIVGASLLEKVLYLVRSYNEALSGQTGERGQ
ncbi:MAG: CDP-alcohol phosphatidyltransferase family protein, partial [Spirochaetales bacterium]|nr:CDP-alcohol phosphatidyltransferase family protein [Spirochaetales bacterium]